VSINDGGRTFLRSYGLADTSSGRELTPADHFRIASITKTFVATAVLQLVEEGKLKLDDVLETYVPDVPNGNAITIRQLLGMRSGVFNYIDDQDFLKSYEADPLLPSWKPADILPILGRHPPNFAPGAKTEYSDSNYVLLGMILEKVTGQSVEQVVEERVIRPLGLGANTSFPTTPAMPDPYARGYWPDGRDFTASNPKVAWTAGAIVSTVPDLTRYAPQLARGELLKPETQAERMKVTELSSGGGLTAYYALGVLTIGDWIGHSGGSSGTAPRSTTPRSTRPR
jgi:D-alanyl-D-alanine carboxypeptidase